MVIFGENTMDLPLGKKVDFWTKYKYSYKSFQSNQCVRKRPLRHFLGLQRDQGQRNSPQKMRPWWEVNRKFFVRALFALKNDSQGSFSTRRHPKGHKLVKNAHFKIWSFLAKNHGLTPWTKVDFWTKYKYSFKSFQSHQCVRKRPHRHFLGLPRDQGQRNSPQKMKPWWEVNRKFFVRALFALKNDSQGSFSTRRDP